MGLEIDTSELMADLYPEERPQPIRIEVGAASNEIAESLVASMNALADRIQVQADLSAEQAQRQELIAVAIGELAALVSQDREAFTAALAEMAEAMKVQPEINVTVPDFPQPIVNVQPPEVNVHLPATSRTVTVKRDPLSGLISSADVVEG